MKISVIKLEAIFDFVSKISVISNRPFSYSRKDPGSSVISIHSYTRGSIEWHEGFCLYCAHSKILQNIGNYQSTLFLFRIAKRSIADSVCE